MYSKLRSFGGLTQEICFRERGRESETGAARFLTKPSLKGSLEKSVVMPKA